jgi:hypothetical protein
MQASKYVVDFIQLLHCMESLHKMSILASIDTGILSVQERLHSKEALQVGNHHLGHAWNLPESGKARRQLAVPDASCSAQVLRARVLTHSMYDTVMDFMLCQSLNFILCQALNNAIW